MQATALTDDDRAGLLQEYLDSIREVCDTPLVMPLDDDGKAPAIEGRCLLDSEEARSMLHTPREAVDAIKDGARGFVLYAGKPSHGTANLVFADHDDTEKFPLDTLPDTLTVVTGSGGYHETFVNAGDVQNANATGDLEGAGEIRAENWYVVLPGSIHPSGRVYQVVADRPVAELHSTDLPEELQPSKSTSGADIDIDIHRDPSVDDTDYVNDAGMSLAECRERDPKLHAFLSTDYPECAGTKDDSRIDAMLVWRLRYHHFDAQQISDIWQHYRWRDKLNREDYIERTIRNCATTDRRWEYTDGETGVTENLPPPHEVWSRSPDDGETHTPRSQGALRKAQTKCRETIEEAFENADTVLIEALPAMGKSYGVVQAVEATGIPMTILTKRHELYDQYREWFEDRGVSARTLPTFHEDCPTIDGHNGGEWRDRVLSLYEAGVSPTKIHELAETRFGCRLPCEEKSVCPYRRQWRFDPSEYDALIGHYVHARNEEVLADRLVIYDEFAGDAYIDTFPSDRVAQAISHYLGEHDSLPFDNVSDLIENRADLSREDEVDRWISECDFTPTEETVMCDDSDDAHALAPHMTYALLTAENLGNGWEYASSETEALETKFVVARDRTSEQLWLLRPPTLKDVRNVVALDGTPAPDLWRLTLDLPLDHVRVLDDEERREYLHDGLGLRIIQTAPTPKPYSSGQWVNLRKDTSLFEWVHSHEDAQPALITTKKALEQYKSAGVLDVIADDPIGYYGNLKGSNRFASEPIGIVAGSPHYGDSYIKRWGALEGKAVESNGQKGNDKSYGPFGDVVFQNMREHQVLQAVLRFGRGETDATVYVHTNALPDWVPRLAHGTVELWSDGMREIIQVLRDDDRDEWQTDDIASDPRVCTGKRNVLDHLKQLHRYGLIEGELSRGWTWSDPDHARLNEHGVVRFGARGAESELTHK